MDLGSKAWAAENLSAPDPSPPPVCERSEGSLAPPQRYATERVSLVSNHLELHYTENCGAAFGLLRNASPSLRHFVLGGAAIVACFALFALFAGGRGGALFGFAVPLIVAGALGNLLDRLRLGYVVDFIRLYWQEPIPFLGTAWPTINFADVTITLGALLLLADGYRTRDRVAETPKNPAIASESV